MDSDMFHYQDKASVLHEERGDCCLLPAGNIGLPWDSVSNF